MSAPASTPVLARARLRRDQPAEALARILVPEEPGARLGAAHSLVWALFADSPDRRRDFLWREMRPGEFLILAARPPSDPHGLFDLEYKPTGTDPTANVHWIQIVANNHKLHSPHGTLENIVDNGRSPGGRSPYYDDGYTADGLNLYDFPYREDDDMNH